MILCFLNLLECSFYDFFHIIFEKIVKQAYGASRWKFLWGHCQLWKTFLLHTKPPFKDYLTIDKGNWSSKDDHELGKINLGKIRQKDLWFEYLNGKKKKGEPRGTESFQITYERSW